MANSKTIGSSEPLASSQSSTPVTQTNTSRRQKLKCVISSTLVIVLWLLLLEVQVSSCSRKFLTGLIIGTLLARNGMQGGGYPMPAYPSGGSHPQQPLLIIIPSGGSSGGGHKPKNYGGGHHMSYKTMPEMPGYEIPGDTYPSTTSRMGRLYRSSSSSSSELRRRLRSGLSVSPRAAAKARHLAEQRQFGSRMLELDEPQNLEPRVTRSNSTSGFDSNFNGSQLQRRHSRTEGSPSTKMIHS